MSPLSFNLAVNKVPIRLDSESGAMDLELREMTAAQRDQYLDAFGSRAKVDDKGKVIGIRSFDGMQAELLSRCLYLLPTNALVPKEVIQTWPGSVVGSLFDAAQKLNLLSKGEDEPKKD